MKNPFYILVLLFLNSHISFAQIQKSDNIIVVGKEIFKYRNYSSIKNRINLPRIGYSRMVKSNMSLGLSTDLEFRKKGAVAPTIINSNFSIRYFPYSIERFSPFIQFQLGSGYYHLKHNPNNANDKTHLLNNPEISGKGATFTFEPGFGVQYITRNNIGINLGSGFYNVLPIYNKNFKYFSKYSQLRVNTAILFYFSRKS